MKSTHRFVITVISTFALISFNSCGNDSKKQESNNSITDKVKSSSSMINKARTISDDISKLKTKQPMDVDKMEAWLPETIMGLQKVKSNLLNENGLVGVRAEYLDTNNEYGKDYAKNVQILIIDGFGEKGAMAVGPYIEISNETPGTSKNGKSKFIDHDGTIVKEEIATRDNSYKFSFLYNGRYGVEMTAKKFDENELWPVFKEFNLQNLR